VTRAYHPSIATLQLVAAISRWEDVHAVRVVSPTHGTNPKPARIAITDIHGEREIISLAKAREMVEATS